MIVIFGEMQTMLRDSARDVCEPWRGAAKLPAASIQAAWRQFGELGWTGVTLPEAQGGSGGSLLDAGVIALELGREIVEAEAREGRCLSSGGLARRRARPDAGVSVSRERRVRWNSGQKHC